MLRVVDFGDADRIVTLLSESQGKVSLVARSARRSKKRFGGALEPCAVISADFAVGDQELGHLREAQVVRSFPGLLASLEKITLACAALEVLREALPARQPEPRVFATAVELFETLDRTGDTSEALLLAFELRLFAILGLAPRLDSCGRCGKRAPEGQAARFDAELGSVVCTACGGGALLLRGKVRDALVRAAAPGWIEASSAFEEGTALSDARRMVTAFVQAHLHRRLTGGDTFAQVRELKG